MAALQEPFETTSEVSISPTVNEWVPESVQTGRKMGSVHVLSCDCCGGEGAKTQHNQQWHKTGETQPHDDGHSPGSFHFTFHGEFIYL